MIAGHSSNLSVVKDVDVLLCLHAARKIIRHFARNIFPANDEQHFRRAVGEEHRCLAGRVAAADDDHGFVSTNLAFERCSGVVNTDSFESLAIFGIEPAIVGAGRDEDGFCSQNGVAAFELNARAVFAFRIVIERESLRGSGKFRAESIRLKLSEPR